MPLPNARAGFGVVAAIAAARVAAANALLEVGTTEDKPPAASPGAARVTTARPTLHDPRLLEVVAVATTMGDTVERASIANGAVACVGVCAIGEDGYVAQELAKISGQK